VRFQNVSKDEGEEIIKYTGLHIEQMSRKPIKTRKNLVTKPEVVKSNANYGLFIDYFSLQTRCTGVSEHSLYEHETSE
jgi:hypothetical protein